MKVEWNKDLTGLNTFRMRVRSRCYVECDSVDELSAFLAEGAYPRPLLPVGRGSNLLFTGDFPGTVLHLRLQGVRILEEGPDGLRVRVEAGVEWDGFCAWCADRGCWGPENLSMIPGEAGAAAVQNIGAYGMEVCQLIESVECLEADGGAPVRIPVSEIGYGYRTSRFKESWKGRYIVTALVLRVSPTGGPRLDYGPVRTIVQAHLEAGGETRPTPALVRAAIREIRRGKLPDPAEMGSAGSFFRNPCLTAEQLAHVGEVARREGYGPVPRYEAGEGRFKVPAAWLIDKCGWKGHVQGNVGVYERQPLVLVNRTGSATPDEVLRLEEAVRDSVRERFAVTLEPEVEHI